VKDKRPWAFVAFDARIKDVKVFRKQPKPEEVLEIMKIGASGGTNYELPLREIMRIIEQEKEFTKADVLFISDGECNIQQEFLEEFISFKRKYNVRTIGVLIGGIVPMLCAALTMSSVGKAAFEMVEEIRRQFREIPGLLEGKEGVKPEPDKCVDIAARAALREMIAPGLVAVLTPVLVGFLLGKHALAGTLLGATTMGVFLALFMANGGGAWDNAKKWIEAGNLGGKGSDNHKAAVVGDTVGDPFKDTSGPAMNILIKLMSVVSLVIAPALPHMGLLLRI